ncbi:sensory box histidine kinase/response regulator [alpha proteobacterium U9-1i]|nr:sensory box histidine kinase/response regulator [alpha proteobacterium U9-1i]
MALGRDRVTNFLPRTIGTGIVTLVAIAILQSLAPLFWFALFVGLVWTDRSLYAQLAKRAEAGDPPSDNRAMIAWTFAQSAYGNLIAPALWFAPYVHGETLGVIYIIAGLANGATSLRAYPPFAIAGLLPTIGMLIGLPIADYFIGGADNPLDLMPLIGAVLFLGFGFNLWRSLVASDQAHARAEASAARERQAAAAAAAAKSDTIRRMRDELRTPMAALIGAAEHLKRAAITPDARQQIAVLVQAGDVLRLVLDDLADLDRLENGMLRVEPKPTDVRELARNVLSAFRSAAHDKGLELFLDIAPDVPARVDVDPLRVRQILFNLIANAVRYTTHGGVRVELRWQEAATPGRVKLAFIVSDTGCGMSRSQVAVVLGRARMSEGERHAQGPGLGLSISLRLARLMGGQLQAQSELGQGSVFSFTLEAPLARPVGLQKGRTAA